MSNSKSSYPFRPDRRRAKSSHTGGKKSRVFFETAKPAEPKIKVAEKPMTLSGFKTGHNCVDMLAFLRKYRNNKVPVKYNDGKSLVRTEV